MNIVNGLEMLLWICLGTLAFYTDIRWGKVYNKHLLFFLLVGFLVKLIQFYVGSEWVGIWLLGLATSGGMAVFLYSMKIWAAGDAKFYVTLLFLTPCSLTKWLPPGLPGFTIAVCVFSLGYAYLLVETLYLLGKNLRKFKLFGLEKSVALNKNAIFLVIIRFYFSYAISSLAQLILYKVIPDAYLTYKGVFTLLQVFVLIWIIKKTQWWKTQYVLIIATFCYLLSHIYMFSSGTLLSMNSLLVVIIVAAARLIGQFFNYQTIPIEQLKAGMVLSYDSVLGFYGSKVKGLPLSTTESTRSRLREEEVQSISRWSKTKRGENQIRIVRHIPFAPFIFLGMIAQLLISYLEIM